MWKRDDSSGAAASHQNPPPPAPIARDAADKLVMNLGKSVMIKGELSGSEDLTLYGRMEGSVKLPEFTLTSGPDAERDLARAAAERGIGFLDAPVSGSIAPARAGTLTALVGGSEADLERARPALEAMTKAQHHLGGVGSGAVMKLALNTMIAVTNEAISELLVLCERSGLERAAAYAALADSALASPFVQYKQAAYLAPDDEPVGFTPKLMLKDLALAYELAAEVGAELPAVEAAREVLERTIAAGRGDEDLVRVADTLRDGAA